MALYGCQECFGVRQCQVQWLDHHPALSSLPVATSRAWTAPSPLVNSITTRHRIALSPACLWPSLHPQVWTCGFYNQEGVYGEGRCLSSRCDGHRATAFKCGTRAETAETAPTKARPASTTDCRAWSYGLAESVRLHLACPGPKPITRGRWKRVIGDARYARRRTRARRPRWPGCCQCLNRMLEMGRPRSRPHRMRPIAPAITAFTD